MSLDYMNPKSNMKSLGVFIFGGSASFGVMEAGVKVDKILELTDGMTSTEGNAYHFSKNFNDIPIVLPKEWENNNYLNSLKDESYDMIYANCPCSSLSQINRNASLDGDKNIHFYRVYNIINRVQPKAFFIENAPTLIKLGYPILMDAIKNLNKNYKFTVIRDYAGHHGVAMKRMRTLVVGWRRDVFDEKIPIVHMNNQEQLRSDAVIKDLYNYPVGDPQINNHTLVDDGAWSEMEQFFNYVDNDNSALLAFIEKWDIMDGLIKNDSIRKEILTQKAKLEAGKRLWDKTPWRILENDICPSMTSVTRIIHPKHNRTFTIREYARLMGYPDDFIFYDECEVSPIQVIAQGVPKNFVKYISSEIKEALLGNRELIENSENGILSFQYHTHEAYRVYNQSELDLMKELDYISKDKNFKKLMQ